MTQSASNPDNELAVAFIGFGEAATAFATGWPQGVAAITAYDVKTDADGDTATREGKLADYARADVRGCGRLDEALGPARVIFSLVTADQALNAARAAAGQLADGTFFFDCNSCSPQTKRQAAEIIDGAGGRYVDVAVMGPVHPLRHKVPLLISGPHAHEALDIFRTLEMEATLMEGDVGTASAIKLVRSIMVKGLEALTVECVTAGRMLGVDDIVLASLEHTFPGFGWEKRAGPTLERVIRHGVRRAAEMSEAASMVEALGIPNRMAQATAVWQQQIGALALDAGGETPSEADRVRRTDAIIAALTANRE
jgi:3-hydroxyisobutyrate dehydrogenase-like beta-hydroxyacid dehydrogenase